MRKSGMYKYDIQVKCKCIKIQVAIYKLHYLANPSRHTDNTLLLGACFRILKYIVNTMLVISVRILCFACLFSSAFVSSISFSTCSSFLLFFLSRLLNASILCLWDMSFFCFVSFSFSLSRLTSLMRRASNTAITSGRTECFDLIYWFNFRTIWNFMSAINIS